MPESSLAPPTGGPKRSSLFFDIYDDGHFAPDYTGIELESIEAAKGMAKRILPDIVKDEFPTGTGATLSLS